MAEPVTLKQMEALFDKKLSPLKEAVSSMETKLEDMTLRIKVIEDAPAHSVIYEKFKSEMSIQIETMEQQFVMTIPGQISQVFEEKEANQYDVKMAEMTEMHNAQSTRMIGQLIYRTFNKCA